MGTAKAVVTRYARLHFGDGGTLDLTEPVSEWDREDFEKEWRAVSVKVEWLRSPRGRLDRALTFAEANRPEPPPTT